MRESDIAHQYWQKVIQLVSFQRGMFLDLGEALHTIKEGELFKHLGEGSDTWKSFLAQPELDISPNTAVAYVKVYDYYCNKLRFKKDDIRDIPVNRLNMMVGRLKKLPNDTQRHEMIDKARVLSFTDFKKEVMGKHEELKTYTCPNCQTQYTL